MAQVKRRTKAAQEAAATNGRNFRTFLLVSQLEAREIGARIAQARNEAGLTQEELVEVASFSKRSLQDYEAGVTIPYRHLREIAGIVNATVPWLLHGEPEGAPGLDLHNRLESLATEVGLLRDEVNRAGTATDATLDRMESTIAQLVLQGEQAKAV